MNPCQLQNDHAMQPLLGEAIKRRRSLDCIIDDNTSTTSPYQPWTCPNRNLIRPKFLLVGMLYGTLMEFLYVQSIRKGYASLEQTAPNEYAIRVESMTDIVFQEMSFLFSDVTFLFYVVILLRSAKNQNLTLNIPIQAANWTTGMVIGLAIAVSTIIGAQTLFQNHGWEVLGSLVVGLLLVFVSYASVVEIQEHYLFPDREQGQQLKEEHKQKDSCYIPVQIV